MSDSSENPLKMWREKKNYLETQLASTADPVQKFALQQQIKECESNIFRLQPNNEQGAVGQSTSPKPNSEVMATNNLPERNRFFTGREEILKELSDSLNINQPVAINQAIGGLGGIGKTQTAIEFCHRHIKNYQAILWTNAETNIELDSSYLQLVSLLELASKQEIEGGLKLEQAVELVKSWLAKNKSWLLVLDNLEDPALAKQYLPNVHQGHILITTRSKVLGNFAKTIKIEKMDAETGALFLLKRSGLVDEKNPVNKVSEDNLKLAKEIVKEMDGLPLALEQAGAYIEQQSSSLAEYLALYKQYSSEFRDNLGEKTENHTSVTTTFSLALKKVKEKSSIAADLLNVCSLLSPDLIPEEIFTESGKFLGDELTKLQDKPLQLAQSVKVLLNYSLIERDAENKSLSIHRLVQAVIVDLMDDTTKQYQAESLVKALEHLCSDDAEDPNNWPKYQRLSSSTLSLFQFANTSKLTLILIEAAYLFHQFGLYCDTQALYSQSLELYQQSLMIYKHHYGDNYPDVADTLNNIAVVYYSQGKYSEALELYQQSLMIKKQNHGDNHPYVADILHNIANVYKNQGKYSKALELYQQSLNIYKEHFGDNHPSVALTLENLGNLSKATAKEQEASDYYKQALAIYNLVLLPSHPWIVRLLNVYSQLLIKLNRYDEAQVLLERIKALKRL